VGSLDMFSGLRIQATFLECSVLLMFPFTGAAAADECWYKKLGFKHLSVSGIRQNLVTGIDLGVVGM
jgi:hypothetical protein